MTTSTRHTLTLKDVEARTATCSQCGPVQIAKSGRGWMCALKKKGVTRLWAASNPEAAKANRSSSSPHRLLGKRVRDGFGLCPLCGDIDIVPYGRGWICGNRARELRAVQQETPLRGCIDCRSYSVVAGTNRCVSCTVINTPGEAFKYWTADSRFIDRTDAVGWDAVHELDRVGSLANLEGRPEQRSDKTVPRVKVLGDPSTVPPIWRFALKANPEWSQLDNLEGVSGADRNP